jgi:hypothetical protein
MRKKLMSDYDQAALYHQWELEQQEQEDLLKQS